MNTKKIFLCRSCKSNKLSKFDFDHEIYPGKRNNNCSNYFCLNCKCISHFYSKKKNLYKNYRIEGSYNFYNKKKLIINPPITLPWSDITFRRSQKILEIIKKKHKIFFKKKIKHLDFGGYNGLLSYALKQANKNLTSTTVDFDPDGLKFSNLLGNKTYKINKFKKNNDKYNFITLVHVIEHLDDPNKELKKLIDKNLLLNGLLYIECPNMFALPLHDPTHLMAFNLEALVHLVQNYNMEVISSGYLKAPEQSYNYGHNLISEKESIYILAKKKENKIKKINYLNYPTNISELKKELNFSYFKIIFSELLPLRIKLFFKNLKYLFGYPIISIFRLFISK